MTLDYERWAELADREAIGEELLPEEKEFLRAFAETDDAARVEMHLFSRMSELEDSDDPAADEAVASRAVAAVVQSARSAPRSRRAVVWATFGGLAAAAAFAFFAGGHRAAEPQASLVEYVGGTAFVEGVRVQKGARVSVGSEVAAGDQPVCLAVEPRIHTCLAAGAKIRISQAFAAERRVDVLAGRAAFALDPLPKGEHFAVVAGGVTSTAVGTAFTVELDDLAHAVRTTVHEGKVRVDAPSGSALVVAHKLGLAKADAVAVEPLGDHKPTETPEWIALATVAGRAIEGEGLVAAAPASEAPAAPAVVSGAGTDEAAPAQVQKPRALTKPAEEAPAATAATATDLLAEARAALREQRWNDAATAYRKLVSTYPNTPEARTAVVPLAKLQVDRLGQPAAALPSLEAYIQSGGSLAVEAGLARIRALRALGRTADEARAIDEFLAAHPNSLETENLRARLGTLRQ